MKTLLVILYVVAAIAPAFGIVLVVANAKKIIRKNDRELKDLLALNSKQIKQMEAAGWGSPEAEELGKIHQAQLIQAGARTFQEVGGLPSVAEMSFVPNFVENMILKRFANRFPTEIILIVVGLLCGAAASIGSLFFA